MAGDQLHQSAPGSLQISLSPVRLRESGTEFSKQILLLLSSPDVYFLPVDGLSSIKQIDLNVVVILAQVWSGEKSKFKLSLRVLLDGDHRIGSRGDAATDDKVLLLTAHRPQAFLS